ncbi:FeoB-associated Cys-rich membrane protein [Loigolactobacillus rennini]|uniref:FeoB-associated Cys-rich membrane protein n=2 Tax=Loigolactobacillus rennini TaxID=238013 RepID=A0A0R2D9Q9_9LACO|nr:FeoB-associated Cys-rich membrane protein [Loigolactobacillus rennini]KRM98644.1 hypothetical protein FC24_GL001160 [Loigolactobacillus rennini DSM 20253]SFZ88884.1 hypothetical protein LREN565_1997 [Loigolactobacillus rennini]
MSFIVNFLISAVIIGWAVWQLVKVIQKSKKGKCAACDYKCEAKKLAVEAKKKAL